MNINCPYCQESIEDNLIKCPYCNEILPEKEGNSWVISLILANPYFGIFGLNNFYNKKKVIGFSQLILTFTFYGAIISIIWAFIDYFMILFDKYTDSKGRKLSKEITIKSTALLTLLFAHRFYVKKYISGLLFAFTLGGLGIWWLIDLVIILTGKFKDAEGNLITE
ncbi:MAG: TM2 domain-containing protein [bacterium]|nr:TM2 domain-containing protein [bacterium]